LAPAREVTDQRLREKILTPIDASKELTSSFHKNEKFSGRFGNFGFFYSGLDLFSIKSFNEL
jgi:hypothetical protein